MSEVRERTLYGRRRGKKLRDGQQSLLATLLPRLTVVVPPEPQKIDLAGLFGGTLPADGVWLEIGFGAGEHLVWQAREHPKVGLIGCEPYINGVAKCLAHIEREGVGNIRLFTDDAMLVMQALLDYIHQQLPDSCYINLIADGDARYLYEKYGFADVAPASIGMALMLQRHS